MKTPLRRILCLAFGLVGCAACPPLGSVMRAYGYTELKPPSNLLQPGAIVYVIKKKPFVAGIICGPRASLGSGWKPNQSVTAMSQLKRVDGKSFNLDLPLLESIRADARFSSIKTIVMTLSNPELYELDDVEVLENQVHRSPACRQAIAARLAQGYKVTMVSSGLKGDVVYSAQWHTEATMSAKAKIDAMGLLALELGGSATGVSENTITAKGLIWGIKDDAYLAALSIPELDEKSVHKGTQIIPAHKTAHMVLTPDAPVVAPPEDEVNPSDRPPVVGTPGDTRPTRPHEVTIFNGGQRLPAAQPEGDCDAAQE